MNFKTHFSTFNSPSGLFQTKEEALLALNAICRKIKRMCEREDCSCLLFGVVSVSGRDTVYRTNYGNKHLPFTKILAPHLHITYIIEKQSTMEKEIKKFLVKRFGTKFFFEPIKDYGYLQARIPYCLTQSLNVRTVDTCNKDFAIRYLGDFVELTEESNRKIKGKKRIFPQYANMALGTDDSVFDFSLNEMSDELQVLTFSDENQAFISPIEKQDNVAFLHENIAYLSELDGVATYQ